MDSIATVRVIFFDGYCVACNKIVDFLLRKDSARSFKFASLQSETAKRVLSVHGCPIQSLYAQDTLVYLRDGLMKSQSDAILSIAFDVGGLYKAALLFYTIPRCIRDMVYRGFARRRYGWFGKTDLCRIPATNEMSRFLG